MRISTLNYYSPKDFIYITIEVLKIVSFFSKIKSTVHFYI